MTNITFIVDTGCQFFGVAGLIDTFMIANQWHAINTGQFSDAIFTTQILSVDGKAAKVNGGFQVVPQGGLQDCQRTDVVVVPPFLPNVNFLPSTGKQLLDWLVAKYEQGTMLASTCTGSFVLAETGLLDGKMATTHWLFAQLFKQRFPKVHLEPKRILTHDEGLVCSGYGSAFYYLGMYLIESFGSSLLAAQCSKSLVVDPAEAGQFSFNVHKGQNDEEMLRVQDMIAATVPGERDDQEAPGSGARKWQMF